MKPPPAPEFRPPSLPAAEPAAEAAAGEAPGPQAGAVGSAQEWRKLTRRLDRLARELEVLVGELPAGEPPAEQAKAMRSGLGRISQHAGALKRRLGIGK